LAREISRSPLPAVDLALGDVLYADPNTLPPATRDAVREFRRRVFDHSYLVLRQEDVLDEANGGLDPAFVGRLPLVNQQLLPLLISDRIEGVKYFRYPGAVYQASADEGLDPPPTGYFVRIPIVAGRDETGVESITWAPVFEPILDAAGNDALALNAPGAQQGLVALRMNYPVQSGAMTGFRHDPDAADYPFEATIGRPNAADDAAVEASGGPWAPTGPLVASDFEFGAYAGTYGLGKQAAFPSPALIGNATGVRPFRRVVAAQAVYRREVFE
jgi:hypothetical protein